MRTDERGYEHWCICGVTPCPQTEKPREARLAAVEAVCRVAEDVYALLDDLRPFIGQQHWPVTRAFRFALEDFRRTARDGGEPGGAT